MEKAGIIADRRGQDLLDKSWICSHLEDLVDVKVRADAESNDIDSSVLDAVRLNDRVFHVVHAAVLQQQNRLNSIVSRIVRCQL